MRVSTHGSNSELSDYQKGMIAGAFSLLTVVVLVRVFQWLTDIVMSTTLQGIVNGVVAWGTTKSITPFELLHSVGIIGLIVLLGSVIIAYMTL